MTSERRRTRPRTADGAVLAWGPAGYYPDRLSGGERQRVAFARALLLNPAVVMADEPTASLDRATADQLIALLRGLVDDGIAVLVASHDQNLIEAADARTELT